MTKDEKEEVKEEIKEQEVEQPTQEKKKKKKKVVRRRKSKKEKEDPLISAIRLVIESGKVELGSRKSIATTKQGKPKLLIIAENTPTSIRNSITESAKASSIPIIEYNGNTMELGSVCGKPFPVSLLSVFDVGTSNILKLIKK